MTKLKLIIDTNIFINGLFFQKTYYHCKNLIDIVTNNNNIELIFSQDTIGELFYMTKTMINVNNISYNDGLKTMNDITKIFYNSAIVNTRDTIAPKCNDEFDDMFLKCYVASRADYILTDDFKSKMNKVNDIKVLDSKNFIQKVGKGEFKNFGVNISK